MLIGKKQLAVGKIYFLSSKIKNTKPSFVWKAVFCFS